MKDYLMKSTKWKEWLMPIGSSVTYLSSNEIQISTQQDAPIIGMYKTIEDGFNVVKKQTKELKDYQLIVDVQLQGNVQIEIGVTLFFNGQTSRIKYYEVTNPIWITGEDVQQMYIALKIYGQGRIILKSIQLKEVVVQSMINIPKIQVFQQWINSKYRNQPDYRPKRDIRVACIADEFTYECLKYEVNLKSLSYSNWIEEVEIFQPQLLLVESAWEGYEKNWLGKISSGQKGHDQELLKLISYCKRRHIPTFFWDKEGRYNLQYFIHTSSLFDYIGMTDETMHDIYTTMHPSKHVCILPFAASDILHHNKDRMSYPLGRVAFAGSWYGDKYKGRIEDIKNILEPALLFGLHIYDRNYSKKQIEQAFKWPERYTKAIVGQLSYREMIEAYRQYMVFLNIQSVKESKWMIPRRVYELLACGVPLITSKGEGIEYQFKEDVYISTCPEETKYWLEWIFDHPEEVEVRANKSREKVMQNHTYSQRVEKILELVGLSIH